MNIFFLTETESGCYKWRSSVPAKYLRRRGHTVQIFGDQVAAAEAPDVLVVFRAHHPGAEKIVQWCKQKKIRVIFDTDDALDLVPSHNVAHRGLSQRMHLYDFLLEQADAVTTTTETLAEHLRNWNPNVFVLPNSVDPEEWLPSPRQLVSSGPVRIGWSGSPTHFHDLAVALDAIRDVQRKHPVLLVLQGICDDTDLQTFYERLREEHGRALEKSPLGKSIRRFLEKLAPVSYEFHPLVPFEQHAARLSDLRLDIGIAPLVEDEFNRFKSCIKYYEYAMAGAVTLASKVLPYAAEVPMLAKNNQQSWRNAIEALLEQDRHRLWMDQREHVLATRNIETTVALWEDVYRGDGGARSQNAA